MCTHVIPTLAAVEDSTPNSYIRLDSERSNDFSDLNESQVATSSTTHPITSGLRSTIRHLRGRGGIWSCFRGFRMYLAFTGFNTGLGFLIQVFLPIPTRSVPFVRSFLGAFGPSMLWATWQMAWVHLVIADKSPRSTYRRMLGFQHWPKIAPAAALCNLLDSATFSMAKLAGWTAMGILSNRDSKNLPRLIVTITLYNFLLLASLPARAIFARVAASMLPEEDDPIVPFDRTFGGNVRPESVGGSGKLGLADAWITFKWPARIRYLKIIFKALAIEVVLGVLAIHVLVGVSTLMF